MITAVVLAAGAATRFGSPKQAVLLEPVLERVRASSSIDDVVVVLGAHDVDTDATTVHCPEWERGPGASLRCGLAALGEDVEAAVVVLGDGPDLFVDGGLPCIPVVDCCVVACRECFPTPGGP